MSSAKNTVLFQPQRMVADTVLFVLVLLMGYYALALWTYSPTDPGFTTTGQSGVALHNAAGAVGAWLADFSRFLLGYGAYAVPPMVLVFALRLFVRLRSDERLLDVFFVIQIGGVILTVFAVSVLSAIHQAAPLHTAAGSAGGVVGQVLATGVIHYLGALGATLLMLGFMMLAFSTVSGLSWFAVFELVGRLFEWVFARIARLFSGGKPSDPGSDPSSNLGRHPSRNDPSLSPRPMPTVQSDYVAPEVRRRAMPVQSAADLSPSIAAQTNPADPVFDAPAVSIGTNNRPIGSAQTAHPPLKSAKAPIKPQPALGTAGGRPIVDLLDFAPQRQAGFSPEVLASLSALIEDRLEEFGVRVDVVAAIPGPVITRFELQPAPGVKVSQISNLSKDLARSLSIISVRVVEVIPGKSTVGL
ncbi:MAG: cell division protein FtsK, partial [Halothiobacillus sp. 28-55-5]